MGGGGNGSEMITSSHVLVILADEVDRESVDIELASRVPDGAAVRVIASPEVSWLQWLTNDEDDARQRAEELASRVAGALDHTEVVEQGIGDTDPVRVAEDAASLGPADAVLVVFSDAASDQERRERVMRAIGERLGVPVQAISLPAPAHH